MQIFWNIEKTFKKYTNICIFFECSFNIFLKNIEEKNLVFYKCSFNILNKIWDLAPCARVHFRCLNFLFRITCQMNNICNMAWTCGWNSTVFFYQILTLVVQVQGVEGADKRGVLQEFPRSRNFKRFLCHVSPCPIPLHLPSTPVTSHRPSSFSSLSGT